MRVYVINQRKQPLMPCESRKAKKLLREGKARVVRIDVFTIQLLTATGENKQEVVAGMDTGSKTIGCAAIANGKVVYQSEVQVRQNVSKKMEQRRMYRRNRRNRKTRYRKARWQNRASMRKNGRLAPSIKSKVDSHLREKRFVESILPISRWKVELANFDIHKITNPDVEGTGYQEGPQKGYLNVKAYVLHRDSYKCTHCKARNVPLHVHHKVFRSAGGTNTPGNLVTLCKTCHEDLHEGKIKLRTRISTTKHATEVGIVSSQLLKTFEDFEETFGYLTKYKRTEFLKLPKSHTNDAIAICCEEGEVVKPSPTIYYKRHVAKGDYQQMKGRHSEIRIPTGKLFGLRKFDLIKTSKGIGFVKGKRSTGFFNIMGIDGTTLHDSVNIKRNCERLRARATTLTQQTG